MIDDMWELTPEENDLIGKHINFYRALDSGEREPTTPEQHHFVQVCRGLARAETPHETGYYKFRVLEATRRAQDEGEAHGIDDGYGEGMPTPGWSGSTAEWRRMRGGYRNDAR